MTITKDSALKEKWEVSSNTTDFTLQSIVDQINNGNKGEGGINLRPFYQREYKFTRKDESLLLESLLGGIPIPVIYMASDTSVIPHVSNVIDGQHRLMAVSRFLENKFKLTGLQKYEELNGLHFSELHPTIQNKLRYQISLTFQLIHTQDDPELEIEIFTRYNQGTNPLTKQEIRHVVYDSRFNDWLVKTVKDLQNNETSNSIFNINKKRFNDKAIHQELYVLLGIFSNLLNPNYSYKKRVEIAEIKGKSAKIYTIRNGVNQDYFSSPEYVNELMMYTKNLEDLEADELMARCHNFIYTFITFLKNVYLDNGIENPLSKTIYGPVKKLNHKMQTSILMIMGSVFFHVSNSNLDYFDKEVSLSINEAIKVGFKNSNFPEVTTSTTEPNLLVETIDKIILSIESIGDSVQPTQVA